MDEKKLQYQREWRRKNKDKVKEIQKRYYHTHLEKKRAYGRQTQSNRKDKVKIYREKRKTENREHYLTLKRAEKERNRLKYIVRDQTRHKYGKAKVCSRCGSRDKVEHHHSEPYHEDHFVDLCLKCHKELHWLK